MKTSKKIIFLIIIYFNLFSSCEEANNSKIPIDPNPIPGHIEQKVSYNEEKLVFSPAQAPVFKILNLKTGLVEIIDIRSKLPSNVNLGAVTNFIWCPYNNNRLLIHTVTSTDTIGDGKRYHYGQNLYILSLDGSELIRVSPSILSPIGASANLSIGSWLIESTKEQDLILLSLYTREIEGQFIYIPQKDEFKDVQVKNVLTFSKKENIFSSFRYSFSIDYSNYYETIYSIDEYYEDFPINRYKCRFDKKFISAKASWSPNGKYIALSVTFDEGNGASNAIWIIDVENFLTNKPYILNPKQIKFGNKSSLRFYSEVWAEFLTDSTLAATMYKSGDDFAYIWEITIDGKIVRQLTFEP